VFSIANLKNYFSGIGGFTKLHLRALLMVFGFGLGGRRSGYAVVHRADKRADH
jgi:hypothetical protein